MSFSVLDSLFLQRQILQGLSGQSNQWLEALNWPDEMRPEQWCQFQTAVQKTFARTRELFPELSCVDVQFLLRDICDVRIQQPLDFTGGKRLICEHFKAFREPKTALLSPSQKTSPPLFSLVEKATEPYRDIAESREKQKSALKQDFFRETGDRFLSSQTKEEFQLERGDAEDEFVMDSEALLPSALWAHRYSLVEAFHAWQPLYEALGKPLALSSEQWLYQEALVQKIQPQLILEIGRSALVSTVALLESAHRLPASCRLFSTSMEEVTEEEVYATLTALRSDSSWLEPLTLHQNALDLFAFDSLLDDTVQEVLLFWYAQDSVSIRSLLKDWLPALHRCRVTLVIKELRDLRFYSPQSGGLVAGSWMRSGLWSGFRSGLWSWLVGFFNASSISRCCCRSIRWSWCLWLRKFSRLKSAPAIGERACWTRWEQSFSMALETGYIVNFLLGHWRLRLHWKTNFQNPPSCCRWHCGNTDTL